MQTLSRQYTLAECRSLEEAAEARLLGVKGGSRVATVGLASWLSLDIDSAGLH